ncbi:MAG: toll/interleukin-1 receptor domain-containing protein [Planctomycetota bacterium]
MLHHQVFISYAAEDQRFADDAVAAIEARNIRCWIAPRDVAAGTRWGGEVVKAIRASKVLVFIYSSHSNQSVHARDELLAAVSAGMRIVPFRVEDVAAADEVSLHLDPLHWIDATKPPAEVNIRKLAGEVESIVNNTATLQNHDNKKRPPPRAAKWPLLAASAVIAGGICWVLFSGFFKANAKGETPERDGDAAVGPDISIQKITNIDELLVQVRRAVPLKQLKVETHSGTPPVARIRGTLFNEREKSILSERIRSFGKTVLDETTIDAASVKSSIQSELDKAGVRGAVVSLWKLKNQNDQVLDIKFTVLPEFSGDAVRASASQFILSDGLIQISPVR